MPIDYSGVTIYLSIEINKLRATEAPAETGWNGSKVLICLRIAKKGADTAPSD